MKKILNSFIFFFTNSDESLNGSKIPAGSHIVPLIGYVHMDETLWNKPTEFNPSRFINAEGKIEKPEFFMRKSFEIIAEIKFWLILIHS